MITIQSLLGVHVVLLLVFLVTKWTSKDSSIASLFSPLFPKHTKALDSDHILDLRFVWCVYV